MAEKQTPDLTSHWHFSAKAAASRNTGIYPSSTCKGRVQQGKIMYLDEWYHLELLPIRDLSSCVLRTPAGTEDKQSNIFILLALSAQMPTIRGQHS